MALGRNKMMEAAELYATWSKDRNKKVGCVIYDPKTFAVLPQGFNGFPRGVDESIEERHEAPLKFKYTVHAELNALLNCARHGIRTEGMAVAITYYPCAPCAGALIQAGIREIYAPEPDWDHHRWGPDFMISNSMFIEAGVHVVFRHDLWVPGVGYEVGKTVIYGGDTYVAVRDNVDCPPLKFPKVWFFQPA